MNTRPLVSVIIPSYNCAQFLPFAIDSLLRQTFGNFEAIVVDDGSSDGTREVMRAYQHDSRIRYFHQANRGLPGARNSGFAEARGDFIAALDADDALAPGALERMLATLQSSGAGWCLIDILKFWDNFQEIRKTEIPDGDLLEGILADDFIRRGMFFRRTVLERVGLWDAEMRMREDWDLNIRLIAAGEKFVYVPEPLYLYRWRPGSITTGSLQKLLHFTREVLRKHHKSLADSGDRRFARIYANCLWGLGRRYLREARSLRNALSCAGESVRYDFDARRLFHPVLHAIQQSRKAMSV